jgi:hypothetical protein
MSTMNVDDQLHRHVRNMMQEIAGLLYEIGTFRVLVGGNSCNPQYPRNDIDLFMIGEETFNWSAIKENAQVVGVTPNAVTVKYQGHVIQFCNYSFASVTDMIDHFDFAHIQIGAEIEIIQEYGSITAGVVDMGHSAEWAVAHILNRTWYCPNVSVEEQHPLASLMRLNKYSRRENQPRVIKGYSMVAILNSLYERGFRSWKDFLHELSAFDILLLEDDFAGSLFTQLVDLYEHLKVPGAEPAQPDFDLRDLLEYADPDELPI